jgi:hypothetical protein
MKKYTLLFICAFFGWQISAQNLQLGWGYTNGSTGADGANDLAIDAAGNTYVTGYFSGTVDFDKGPGTANLSTNGNQSAKDAFVLKLDPQGNYVWAVRFGGTNNYDQEGTKIALDQFGNVVVIGTFLGNLQLGANSYNAGSTTLSSPFMIKLDTSGTLLWGNAWVNGTNNLTFRDLDIDNANNMVIVGHFSGSCDFDPSSSSNNKTSVGGLDLFVAKLNANGLLLDVKTGGNSNSETAASVCVTGNSYWVYGGYKGIVDFDFGSGTDNMTSVSNSYDNYLLHLSSNLSHIDVKSFGGSNDEVSRELKNWNGVNLFAIGLFDTSADLDPSPTSTFNVTGTGQESYVLKLDLTGDLIWAKTFGGSSYCSALDVEINNQGNVFTSGRFSNTVDFNPSPTATFNLTTSIQDGFLLELDNLGNFVNAFQFGSNSTTEEIPNLALNQSQGPSLVGYFYSSIDLDPSSSTTTATSAGLDDMLVLKLISCSDTIVNTTETACGSYTLTNGQTITQSGTYNDTLQTTLGCDSVVARAITINPLPNTALAWQGGTLLIANGNTTNTHTWIDCTTGLPIPGATGTSYTPTGNGSFAVVVNNGTCTDTSNCESLTNFSLPEVTNIPIKLYPNPTSGLLRLESPQPWQKVEVVDVLGNLLITQQEDELNLAKLPAGMYLVKVYFEEGVVVERVVKE